jgi:hypothetical protein
MLYLFKCSRVHFYITWYFDFVLNTGTILLASNRALMKSSLDVLPHWCRWPPLPASHNFLQLVHDKGILETRSAVNPYLPQRRQCQRRKYWLLPVVQLCDLTANKLCVIVSIEVDFWNYENAKWSSGDMFASSLKNSPQTQLTDMFPFIGNHWKQQVFRMTKVSVVLKYSSIGNVS